MVSKQVFQIRDAALGILNRVAHGSFWPPETSVLILGIGPIEFAGRYEEQWGEATANAQAWWNKVQSKGEHSAVLDIVSSGQLFPDGIAKFLVEKYPSDALDALTKGITSSESDPVHLTELITLLGQLNSASKYEVAHRVMAKAEYTPLIVACAKVIAKEDPVAAISALSKHWKELGADNEEAYRSSDAKLIADNLLAINQSDGIDALANGLAGKRPFVRQTVLRAVEMFVTSNVRLTPQIPGSSRSKRVSAALERLAASELTDVARIQSTGLAFDPESGDLRICDLAAASLSKISPQEYRFERKAPMKVHDLQIQECLHTWHQKVGTT